MCGYCMRRLNSAKDVKIEHLLPQSKLKEDPKEALNYKKNDRCMLWKSKYRKRQKGINM